MGSQKTMLRKKYSTIAAISLMVLSGILAIASIGIITQNTEVATKPSPTPTITNTPTQTPQPLPSAKPAILTTRVTPTPTPTPTSTPTPILAITQTPTADPTSTPTPTPTETVLPNPSPTPSPTNPFGNTASTTLETVYNSSVKVSGGFTLSQPESITSIIWYGCETGGATYEGVIYNSSNGLPYSPVVIGQQISEGSNLQWWSSNVTTPVTLSAGTYFIGFACSSGTHTYGEETGSATCRWYEDQISFQTLPDPIVPSGSGTNLMAVYATYTTPTPSPS